MKTTIENQINSIFRLISRTAAETTVVVKERPAKGASGKGIISVYRIEDLREDEKSSVRCSFDGEVCAILAKPFKARPVESYVFYSSVYDDSRLGSVAIYGADAATRCMMINRVRSFFGIMIKEASLEMGRRPFVDVKFFA